MHIKLFHGHSPDEVQQQIDGWLSDYGQSVEIIQMAQSQSVAAFEDGAPMWSFTLTLLYR